MNIQELLKQAINRIDSMSIDELRAKFIEHGYVPAKQESLPYSRTIQGSVSIPSCPTVHKVAASQVNYSFGDHSEAIAFQNSFEHPPVHKIPANEEKFSTLNDCNFDLAA